QRGDRRVWRHARGGDPGPYEGHAACLAKCGIGCRTAPYDRRDGGRGSAARATCRRRHAGGRRGWNEDVGRSGVASELGPHMKLLDSAIDAFLARFGNAARLLAEQLDAHGVRVWLSAGCLTEFAEIARVAAGRSRQVEEPYGSCLRREMQTLTRFIWEWTDS